MARNEGAKITKLTIFPYWFNVYKKFFYKEMNKDLYFIFGL